MACCAVSALWYFTKAWGKFLPKLSCSIIHFSRAPSAAKSFYCKHCDYVQILVGNIGMESQNFQSSSFLLLFVIHNSFLNFWLAWSGTPFIPASLLISWNKLLLKAASNGLIRAILIIIESIVFEITLVWLLGSVTDSSFLLSDDSSPFESFLNLIIKYGWFDSLLVCFGFFSIFLDKIV